MVGRSATSATWSGPFSSAIRRRASASTSAVKRRRPAGPRPGPPPAPPGPRASRPGDDPVHQLGGGDPPQRGVGRPRRQPGPAPGHRAEPADRLDREVLERARSSPASSAAAAGRGSRPGPPRRPRTAPDASRSPRVGVAGDPVPDKPREVEVEDRVEGGPLDLPLDQGRGVRVAHDPPVVPADPPQRGDGVQALGQRHRQSRRRAAPRRSRGACRAGSWPVPRHRRGREPELA